MIIPPNKNTVDNQKKLSNYYLIGPGMISLSAGMSAGLLAYNHEVVANNLSKDTFKDIYLTSANIISPRHFKNKDITEKNKIITEVVKSSFKNLIEKFPDELKTRVEKDIAKVKFQRAFAWGSLILLTSGIGQYLTLKPYLKDKQN